MFCHQKVGYEGTFGMIHILRISKILITHTSKNNRTIDKAVRNLYATYF